MRPIDLTGRRFGRLIAIRKTRADKYGHWNWLCRCDCGKEVDTAGSNLRSGCTKSCGCYLRDLRTTHGDCFTPEYKTWSQMRQRCNNRKNPDFRHYGGRGIKVCARWRSYPAFLEDMGKRPSDLHTIDRVDNNGPYSPENCRWISRKAQAQNTRRNVFVEYRGETKTVSEWADAQGLAYHTLQWRPSRWPLERAMSEPAGKQGRRAG